MGYIYVWIPDPPTGPPSFLLSLKFETAKYRTQAKRGYFDLSKLGLSENMCFQGFSLYHRYICETNIVGINDRVRTNHLVHEEEILADIIE